MKIYYAALVLGVGIATLPIAAAPHVHHKQFPQIMDALLPEGRELGDSMTCQEAHILDCMMDSPQCKKKPKQKCIIECFTILVARLKECRVLNEIKIKKQCQAELTDLEEQVEECQDNLDQCQAAEEECVNELEALQEKCGLSDDFILIPNPDTQNGYLFGYSVAMSSDGSKVAVGSFLTGFIGAVYLFDDTGLLLQTFMNPTPTIDDNFGRHVAMNCDGSRILVGAYLMNDGENVQAGAAYLFDDTGLLKQTFTNPYPADYDQFGSSVAMSGDGSRILIGAPGDNTINLSNLGVGAAYLFNGDDGLLLWTFNNPTPMIDDQFGISVAMNNDGSRILIGAIGDDSAGVMGAGAAYMYDGNGALLMTFQNPDPNPNPIRNLNDYFGHSVAMNSDGSKILIGAIQDTMGVEFAGAAYLFSNNGTLLWTFNNPTPAYEDFFGFPVAMSSDGSRILIGAYGDDTDATNAGVAYLFDDNGSLLMTIQNPSPAVDDFFGYGLAMNSDGSKIVIGAIGDDMGATDAGTVYLYGKPPRK